jgi:lipid-A-disaccharide synthase
MTYYLVAGEASGDLHGANLMKALKLEDSKAVFRYFGGDKMKAEGGELVKHYADMAFMGFTEVIMNLNTIFKNLKFCKEDILAFKPDVLILIDFPGFNLKIADFAHKKGIKVFYYISPKIWAWNQKRVLKIKKVVDKMFCILPFEVDFYHEWGMKVDYVGNPLLDEKSNFKKNPNFLKDLNLQDQAIIALLPGSRKQEIEYLLPDMVQVADQFPDCHFMIAAAPGFSKEYYEKITGNRKISIVFNETYDLLSVAHAAIVASGTATLEAALFKVPQVVVYKGGAISIAIARALVKIRFISLVNLIMDRKVVEELIQNDCNPIKITRHLKEITTGPERQMMMKDYEALSEKMGLPGASEKAAKLMVSYLRVLR